MGLLKFSRGTDARSSYESVLREARYFENLDRSRFTMKDLAYATFAGDVFHDGEILFRGVQLASRQVTLSFRNVHAMDAISGERRKSQLPRVKFCRKDFQTRVVFTGVRQMTLPDVEGGGPICYQFSNLSRYHAGYDLRIAVWGKFWSRMGVIGLRFGGIQVEDIGQRISGYLPPGSDVRPCITWVTHSPGYYARLRRRQLEKMNRDKNGDIHEYR